MSQGVWNIKDFPSSQAQATASTRQLTAPAGGSIPGQSNNTPYSQCYRLRSLQCSLSGTAVGVATLTVRDGATGAGDILLETQLGIPANGFASFNASSLDLRAIKTGILTVEFTAGTTDCQQAVNAQGDLVQVGAPWGE